ncbi:MAG TPA: protease pro-enzyme activation domain-containing protein [Acidobacteriaceae bacterium]|nr:protease pro-enzyme activation domain-containing protein [Acidobacteriaceae bacterium]
MASRFFARLLLNSVLCAAGILGFCATTASAQVSSRITAPIASTSTIPIAHSIHPRAMLSNDLGPKAENTMLHGMSIRFNMTDAQQAALDQLLNDLQNPSSPRFQQWLTPAQYAAQFGMSAADLAKVSAWLTSRGFTVTGVANGGSFITFDGTVGQVQRAFATSIHTLSANGETHFANMTEVSLPSAFAGSVAAVTGLHDFRLKPRVQASVVRPLFTSSVSGSHFIAPGDLYTIYNMGSLMNSYTGAGMTVAVTGQVDINAADVSAFRSASGLSTTNLPVIVHAGSDPGPVRTCTNCSPSVDDLDESSLDVEWAGAMAPSATIDFVVGVDVFNNSMTYAIDNNVAPIVTTSYGLCEAGDGSSGLLSLNALFKQANAQGQTILAAAGDQGATDCDAGPVATTGLSADFPASSPYVTGMGGTQLNEGNATGATSYWSATNGTLGQGSALSYIPETVWDNEPLGSYGGTGGGASAFFTKPVWQIGTGVPADGSRDVPDIALTAANGHDPLLYCVSVAAGTSCGSGFRVSSTNDTLTVAGGTSFDSQIFGGMLALIEQKIGHRVGNANPTLYALANNPSYYTPGATILTSPNVVFNDVTTGNNSEPCTAGTPNCGNGGLIGYSAGAGYDRATGWGSVNLTNLANAWSLVTPLGVGTLGANNSVTTLTASPSNITAGATVTLTATVSGSAGSPTGTVQFFANGVAIGGPVTLSGNTAMYSWVTGCSALGQQVLTASYSGDVNYQGSKGPALQTFGGTTQPVEVQVTGSNCPDFSLSASTTSVSVAAGGTIPAVTITAVPSGGFTGTVNFSAVLTSTSTGYAPTFTFSPASASITSGPVTTSLSLSGITAELRMPRQPARGESPWYLAGSGATVASLLLLVVPRRRKLGGLLLVFLAVALVGGATGCGSSQSGPPTTTTSTNVYAGTYVVTVTGTYTSPSNQVTQHTVAITYNIQ